MNVSYYVDVLCTYAISTTVSLCSKICDVLIFSLDFSINEFIQNYAFDSHSTPNVNLIDLTLTYTHALFVFDIDTLLVLWCALFL